MNNVQQHTKKSDRIAPYSECNTKVHKDITLAILHFLNFKLKNVA